MKDEENMTIVILNKVYMYNQIKDKKLYELLQ